MFNAAMMMNMMNSTKLCVLCKRKINTQESYLKCEICKNIFHITCLESEDGVNIYFNCQKCVNQTLPFNGVDDDELDMMFFNYNENIYNLYQCCKDLNVEYDTRQILCNNDIDPDMNFYNVNCFNSNDSLYYLECEFNQMYLSKSNSGLSIIHLNCRSLLAHFNNIENYLLSLKNTFDIIALSETWLKDSQDIKQFNMDGFTIYSNPRKHKCGGGVAIYVNENFDCNLNVDLTSCIENCMESIAVEIKLSRDKSLLVQCIYRAPNTDLELFNTKFEEILDRVMSKSSFICGDFNLDLMKNESHNPTKMFLDNLYAAGHFPLITKPTRITTKSYSLIDNIFSNELNVNIKSGILVTDISDHLPIFAITEIGQKHIAPSEIVRNVRKFTESNICNMRNELHNTDWKDLFLCNDVNDTYDIFVSTFVEILDRCCPISKMKLKKYSHYKPWFTKGLKNACKKKNSLYKNWLKYKTESTDVKYKRYKNKLTYILRSAEKSYYCNKLEECRNDMKKTWKILNDVTKRKTKSNRYQKEFVCDGIMINDGKTICNKFNDFFTNIGPNLAEKINPVPGIDYSIYMKEPLLNSMFLSEVSTEEIVRIVNNFKAKTSCGYDNINMSLVKNVIDCIATPLAYICKLSFNQGMFPDKMKIARVMPLFKAGCRQELSNYRPVSVLPQFSKILEKLFNKRLLSYMDKYNILDGNQYGFRSNHSTSLALFDMVENITESIDQGNYTAGVFIDLKKAFDTINHNILLKKLYHYGIRGVSLAWLKSYITNRKQYVTYNNFESSKLDVLCGVPQGSILGPMLFILYINDLSNISNNIKFILFADDTNIFCTGKDQMEVQNIFNTELKILSNWFVANKLSLNVQKTKYIVFGHVKPDDFISITIDDNNIERVNCIKFLGVTIDSKFSWIYHIQSVVSKVSKSMSILYRVRNILDERSLYSLYCSLILPYLNYGCEIWGNTYSSNLIKLTMLQKRIIRVICNEPFRAHTNVLFNGLKCLKFIDIIELKTLCIVYKAKNGLLPVKVQRYFTNLDSIHSHNTRQSSNKNFYCIRSRTRLKQFGISIRGVQLWNNLDVQIRNIKSIGKFKNTLKKIFLDSYIV